MNNSVSTVHNSNNSANRRAGPTPDQDAIALLLSEFDGTVLPVSPTHKFAAQHGAASRALAKAAEALKPLPRLDSYEAEHSVALTSAADLLRRAAAELDLLGRAVTEHRENGVTVWSASDTKQEPLF